jgi:hypothetical protein
LQDAAPGGIARNPDATATVEAVINELQQITRKIAMSVSSSRVLVLAAHLEWDYRSRARET